MAIMYISRMFLISILLLIISFANSCGKKEEKTHEVRLLAWVGYDEADLVAPFEKETGIKVETKTFLGGSQMFSFLKNDPQAFDVVVLDPEYIQRVYDEGLLEKLDPKNYDFSGYFPIFLKNNKHIWINEELYAVPVRFGIIGLLYNVDRVIAEEMRSYQSLWNPKYKGKIAMIDLYQPNIGVVSLKMKRNGADPYNLSNTEFDELRKELLSLKSQVYKIFSSPAPMIESLAKEVAWIMVGGGEANANSLLNRGINFDWKVPDEGGIVWTESLGLVKGAKNRDEGIALIRYLQSPQGQAKLARRKAYISSPTSFKAAMLLSDKERELRKISTREAAEMLLKRVSIRELPKQQEEEDWIRLWNEFKAY